MIKNVRPHFEGTFEWGEEGVCDASRHQKIGNSVPVPKGTKLLVWVQTGQHVLPRAHRGLEVTQGSGDNHPIGVDDWVVIMLFTMGGVHH